MTRDWTGSTLGDRVKHLAELRGVSISRLGEQAGLTRSAIHRMAKDRSSEVKRFAGTIDRIAQTWNVSSEWLFYGRGEPDRPAAEAQVADPFPHRAHACSIALDGGIDPEAVRATAELTEEQVHALLTTYTGQTRDATVLWWLHHIESRALAMRAAARGAR